MYFKISNSSFPNFLVLIVLKYHIIKNTFALIFKNVQKFYFEDIRRIISYVNVQ